MKKKILLFAAAIVFTMLFLGSCKSSADCPAYSQTDVEQTEQNV